MKDRIHALSVLLISVLAASPLFLGCRGVSEMAWPTSLETPKTHWTRITSADTEAVFEAALAGLVGHEFSVAEHDIAAGRLRLRFASDRHARHLVAGNKNYGWPVQAAWAPIHVETSVLEILERHYELQLNADVELRVEDIDTRVRQVAVTTRYQVQAKPKDQPGREEPVATWEFANGSFAFADLPLGKSPDVERVVMRSSHRLERGLLSAVDALSEDERGQSGS